MVSVIVMMAAMKYVKLLKVHLLVDLRNSSVRMELASQRRNFAMESTIVVTDRMNQVNVLVLNI
jgi:hypothetical protein